MIPRFQHMSVRHGGHWRGNASGERDDQTTAVPGLPGSTEHRYDHYRGLLRLRRLVRVLGIWKRRFGKPDS